MQPGARRRPYTAAAALPVADKSSSRRVRPALGIWVAGGTREARWCTDVGARAAILDCEASICNRELAAAPTPPRLPSRWQIIAQVEECAPPSVSGRQAGLEWHAGARMALLGFRGGCGRRKLARGAWDYTGGWVSAGCQSVSELGGSIRHHSHSHSLGKVKFRFTGNVK